MVRTLKIKTTFEETQADFLGMWTLLQETFMSFNEKLNRLSWEKMMYILWFHTEGHFVLLKREEIFPERNDFTDFW